MAKITLFDKPSMDADIAGAAGALQVLQPPKGMKFKVEVEFDSQIEKAAGKDPLLQQKMQEAAKKVYADLVAAIGKNLQATDKGGVILRDANQGDKLQKLVTVVNAGIKGAADVANGQAEKAVLAVWEAQKTKVKEYAKYRVKIAVAITTNVASLAVSIGLLASTPFHLGVGTPLGIIGMIKNVVTITREVVSAAQEVEQSQAVLRFQVNQMQGFLKKSESDPEAVKLSKAGKANEYHAAVVQTFFGISQPCIKTCEKNLGTAKNKLKGIELGCHSLAKDLAGLLVLNDKLKAEFMAEAKKKLDAHPNPKAAGTLGTIKSTLDAYLKPNETLVGEGLTAVHAAVKRAAEAKTASDELVKEVAKLSALRGKGPVVVENILATSSMLLSPLGGEGFAGVEKFGANIGKAAATYAVDRIRDKVLSGSFLV